MRWRIAATLLLLLGAAFAAPTRSAAHAEIVSTSPDDGSSLPTSPEALTLVFSEAIDPITAVIELLDERGVAVPGLGTLTVDQPATTASVPLPSLSAGLYTVTYRIASADDGHLTEGRFSFLIDPTGTRSAPGSTAASASLSSGPGSILTRWLALAGALTLVGVAVFWLASALPAMKMAGLQRSATGAPWALLAASAGTAFVGLAAYLTLAAAPLLAAQAGGPPGEGFPLDFAAPFGATRFALAMRLALVGAGIGVLLITARVLIGRISALASARSRIPEVAWLVAVAVSGTASLTGTAIAGHPASIGGPLFALADGMHLLAVACWLGTLPGALALARRTRGLAHGRALLTDAFRRHGRVALVAAPMVALTGLANSPLLLGSTRALVTSDYGNLIVAKALLFSVAVAIGALNFLISRSAAKRPILPLIGGELMVGGLALVLAATLITGQPAVHRSSALVRPAVGALQLGGAAGENAIRLSVNLPAPGIQRYQASVTNVLSGSVPTDLSGVVLVFEAPVGSGLASTLVPLVESTQPGLWGATGAYTPVPGNWHIGVLVQRAGVPALATRFEVPVATLPPLEQVPAPATGIGVPSFLAFAWQLLPQGAAGWLVPGLLLGVLLLVQVGVRAGMLPTIGLLRGLLVTLAVTSGLLVEARAALDAANAPTAAAVGVVNPTDPSADSIDRGRRLYLANCSSCHGTDGSGDGPTAIGMLPPPRGLETTVPGQTDGTLAFWIANGISGTAMPAFAGDLGAADRWDLVNYLRAAFPGTD